MCTKKGILAFEFSTLLLNSVSATQLADKVEATVLERLKPLLIKAQVTDSSHFLAFGSSEMKGVCYLGHTDPFFRGSSVFNDGNLQYRIGFHC